MNAPMEWTVDQALLWLGTGNIALVHEASPAIENNSRWTWMTYRLAVVSNETEAMRFGAEFAEQTLLSALMRGQATALVDDEPIKPSWFYKSELSQASADEAHLLNSREGEMIFRRRQDGVFQTSSGNFFSKNIEAIAPLIPAEYLLSIVNSANRSKKARSSNPSERNLVERFTSIIGAWHAEGAHPTTKPRKNEQVQEAMSQTGASRELAKRAFDKAASEYPEIDWSRRGPPRRA